MSEATHFDLAWCITLMKLELLFLARLRGTLSCGHQKYAKNLLIFRPQHNALTFLQWSLFQRECRFSPSFIIWTTSFRRKRSSCCIWKSLTDYNIDTKTVCEVRNLKKNRNFWIFGNIPRWVQSHQNPDPFGKIYCNLGIQHLENCHR